MRGPATGRGLDAAVTPEFGIGFTGLLRSLHAQLPRALVAPLDLSFAADKVELRGLLRERLSSGRQPLGAFLAGGRRVYATLSGDRALSASNSNAPPLVYTLVVTPESDVLLRWKVESSVGALGGGGLGGDLGLRIGLPVRIRGEVRLRPDAQTGAVQEVWVKSLTINERPVLPGLLSSWVQRSADGGTIVAPDVARDARAILEALVPWLRAN